MSCSLFLNHLLRVPPAELFGDACPQEFVLLFSSRLHASFHGYRQRPPARVPRPFQSADNGVDRALFYWEDCSDVFPCAVDAFATVSVAGACNGVPDLRSTACRSSFSLGVVDPTTYQIGSKLEFFVFLAMFYHVCCKS